MRILFILLIILFQVGCVTVPEYLINVHDDRPENIERPSEGNSSIVFMARIQGGYQKLSLLKYDGKSITGMTRNLMTGFEFEPGDHELEIGLLKMIGELNWHVLESHTIKYAFEPNTKYLVNLNLTGEKRYVLQIEENNGNLTKVLEF